MRVSSRAVIIEDGKVLTMFRRKVKDGNAIEYYVIPGGGVEEGETLEETVLRELKEEMNVDIKILGYLGKEEKEETTGHFYHCEILSGEPHLSGPELERNSEINYYEPRFVDIEELKNLDFIGMEFVNKALNKDYE